jgi:hypothetical protein
MSDDDLEQRVRTMERTQAVHEAVCAERYKGITLRLNLLLGLLVALVGAAAAGNPVIAAITRIAGG